MKKLLIILISLLLIYWVGTMIVPSIIEKGDNPVKNLVGVEHVALGSDYDGSITAPFDITGFPILVEALLQEGFTEDEIQAIMGENVKRFLMEIL